MKQVFNLGGEIVVEEVPTPACAENEVLVQNAFSVISAGTEGSSLKNGGKGIIGLTSKAKNNPKLVLKAIDMARHEGLGKTLDVIRGQVESKFNPMGYSSSGIVLEIGKNITNISVGDRVACGGIGYASHAEIVAVPSNLVCRMLDNVDFNEAAFTTLGAIALQGIRRAKVQLGDKLVVIGLGLIGQITCQILKACGAYVIGIDPINSRVKLARELGADVCLGSGKNAVSEVFQYTNGIGADAVIICAATTSSAPVKQAIQMARKKGKLIVVGAVGMELDRSPLYEKELDFLISCSYGPGRYDPIYEEKGIDYPIGYVRWTENRNMQAFLELLADKKVDVKRLINQVSPIEEADQAYQALKDTGERPITILFRYTMRAKVDMPTKVSLKPLTKVAGKIHVAVIGAGSFARTFHLPNLNRIPLYNIKAIVTKTGSNAKSLAKKYGAEYYTTDYRDVLNDKVVSMVLIATRHNLHAPLIVEAAHAGKNIFVEKPIALTYEQCREVYEVINSSQVNLVVGFNRRFSPLAQTTKRLAEKRKNPTVISVRVNSHGIDRESWVNDPVEGGGSIVGEACHFFDFTNWLIGAEPRRIYAEMISLNNASVVDSNNVVCTINYEDGSIASLVYTTVGHESLPKERIEVFMDGGSIVIDDFKQLGIMGLEGKEIKLPKTDKGQFRLLKEYSQLLNGESKGEDLPNVRDGVKATIFNIFLVSTKFLLFIKGESSVG